MNILNVDRAIFDLSASGHQQMILRSSLPSAGRTLDEDFVAIDEGLRQ
jgi:hypothetical protein